MLEDELHGGLEVLAAPRSVLALERDHRIFPVCLVFDHIVHIIGLECQLLSENHLEERKQHPDERVVCSQVLEHFYGLSQHSADPGPVFFLSGNEGVYDQQHVEPCAHLQVAHYRLPSAFSERNGEKRSRADLLVHPVHDLL